MARTTLKDYVFVPDPMVREYAIKNKKAKAARRNLFADRWFGKKEDNQSMNPIQQLSQTVSELVTSTNHRRTLQKLTRDVRGDQDNDHHVLRKARSLGIKAGKELHKGPDPDKSHYKALIAHVKSKGYKRTQKSGDFTVHSKGNTHVMIRHDNGETRVDVRKLRI